MFCQLPVLDYGSNTSVSFALTWEKKQQNKFSIPFSKKGLRELRCVELCCFRCTCDYGILQAQLNMPASEFKIGAEFLPDSLLSKNKQIKIYRNIILPVVLYECETWSLTLRGKNVGWGFSRIGC